MPTPNNRIDWPRAVFFFVFATLAASAVYALVAFLSAPGVREAGEAFAKAKSDYALMLLQCALGLLVMFLPSLIERRLRIAIPGLMYIVFVVFLYAAIFLGEIRSFYFRFTHWDLVLHTFSGLMLGALGFSVVDILNDSDRVKVRLSPLFVSLFAFFFAVSLGVLWEVYEFSVDGLFGLNMQKFALEDGKSLVGRAALADTMGDLIVDAAGAMVAAAAGFFSIKRRMGLVERLRISRAPRAGAVESSGDQVGGATGGGTCDR